MEYSMECRVVLTLDHKKGSKKSEHVATDFNLSVSENLDQSVYLDKDGVPTEIGSKTLTNVLVQGLVGNIHQAHQNGYWDRAEHLRYAIAELERGFAGVATAYKANFET